jgi:hypothetical protein
MIRRLLFPCLLALAVSLLPGCRNLVATKAEYQMGDKVTAGSLTYNVVEKVWRSQLGENFQMRMPENRFLVITVSVTNNGNGEVSVPLLELESSNGKMYREAESGEGLDGWIGLLRTLGPQQTLQGRILFDVPLGSYRLRLSNGDSASANFSYVQIPLQLDQEQPPVAPVPGK